MIDRDLISQEWNQVAWGNYETNLRFLSLAGLDRGPRRILEIGCGKGAVLGFLQSLGHTVHGIDVDSEAIAECNRDLPGVDARVGSGAELHFEAGMFDVVLSLDVFEHIRDSDRHLREVHRVLKPGGSYLLQTPNKWTNIPFEMLRQWKKFHTGPIQSYRTLTQDHCALHSYRELKARFSSNGFELTFMDLPVVNDYFRTKLRTYMGKLGPALLTVVNPDRLPMFLRTNFYARATPH
jgi:2-polyprenyl-3-methyl-5-hydroxy-6-metoxy-1,4-benzoquinol methylase